MIKKVKINTLEKQRGRKMQNNRIKEYLPLYLMLAPALIITFVFLYMPLPGLIISFMDYDMFEGFAGSKWVGLANIIRLIELPNVLQSVVNTLTISVLSIIVVFPIPILLAVLLNEVKNNYYKRTIQTVTYLPHFLSWISVIGIAYSFYSINGTFNDLRVWLFGEDTVRNFYLGDNSFFIPNVLIITIWKETGWSSILYLAALTGIDMQLYEAAALDGAGRFRQFVHVTLPGIAPTVIIMLILKIGQVFASNFDLIYGLQNPFIEFDVISTVVYKSGIEQGEFEVSTALGFMQGIIALILTMTADKLSKKINGVSIW